MFDTIKLSTSDLDLDPSRLMHKGWTKVTSEQIDAEGVVSDRVSLRLQRKEASPHFLAYSPARGELGLETSLPKILYGENVSLIPSDAMPRALDELSNRVGDLIGLDIPHCAEWNVRGRADAVFNWSAKWGGSSHVGEYLHALKALELPRHMLTPMDREGSLTWKNHSRWVRLYDKYRECPIKEADGILRFEVEMKRAKTELAKIAGAKSMKAKEVLTWENARAVLSTYLESLGVDLVVTDEEQLARTLVQKLRPAKARRLMGLIHYHRLFSRDELVGMGFERTMLWRDVREINKIGLSVATSKRGLLPPLELPKDYSGEPGRLHA